MKEMKTSVFYSIFMTRQECAIAIIAWTATEARLWFQNCASHTRLKLAEAMSIFCLLLLLLLFFKFTSCSCNQNKKMYWQPEGKARIYPVITLP